MCVLGQINRQTKRRERGKMAQRLGDNLSISEYEKPIDWDVSLWRIVINLFYSLMLRPFSCCELMFLSQEQKTAESGNKSASQNIPRTGGIFPMCAGLVGFVTCSGSSSEQGRYWGAQPKELLWSGRVWCTKPSTNLPKDSG